MPAPRPGCAGQPTPALSPSGGQRSHGIRSPTRRNWCCLTRCRGCPDEFARYLEELASATVAALICVGYPANARVPGTDRLSMAKAARTGLAAGLGLLGVGAPDRL